MFTASEVAKATGGRLIGDGNAVITGVSTDTRTIEKGTLFVAVKGERFDGNDFIADAVSKGAAAVISDRVEGAESYSAPVILASDSRTAQLSLARYHRERFNLKLCGVTGSVGKTSTKDMIYAVLSEGFKTLKTEGNFNNDIGLPRTLFGLDDSYGAVVIEMGMSDLGEISVLSRAAVPDCAVITNIGYCHIENLKTRDNILKAKLEILDGARENAPLIVCGDDEYLSKIERPERTLIRCGFGENNHIRAVEIKHLPDGEKFTIADGEKRLSAEIPVSGEHHILNALMAYAVGKCFGLSESTVTSGLMNYAASGMRQRTEKHGNLTFIMDCYNASPTSMKSSLSVLKSRVAEGRKIAVLGDMLELGEMSAQLHAMVADYVSDSADVCFLYGAEMSSCEAALRERGFEVYRSEDKAELSEKLKAYVKDGDLLLFKGSRGMRMEDIADNIK